MYDHSAAAALFGMCECSDCRNQKENPPENVCLERTHDDFYDGVTDHKDWHMWGIRSPDYKSLFYHRIEMVKMGCIVGPISASRGWKEDMLPMGMFHFSARILRSQISEKDLSSLEEWDRKHSGDSDIKAAKGESDAG